MNASTLADKLELQELANKLFMYTDGKQWDLLMEEVFATDVWFDMKSAGGGEPSSVKASAICEMWDKGFEPLDAVHHQAGHYLIKAEDSNAEIFAYAVALHYRKAAVNGKSRSFVGSYDLKAVRTDKGWRLNQFRYNLKFIDGNAMLE
jgi:hypothetical protein